jgi:hypothetical protein
MHRHNFAWAGRTRSLISHATVILLTSQTAASCRISRARRCSPSRYYRDIVILVEDANELLGIRCRPGH